MQTTPAHCQEDGCTFRGKWTVMAWHVFNVHSQGREGTERQKKRSKNKGGDGVGRGDEVREGENLIEEWDIGSSIREAFAKKRLLDRLKKGEIEVIDIESSCEEGDDTTEVDDEEQLKKRSTKLLK